MKKFFLILILQLGYASDDFYYQEGKKVLLTPIETGQKFQKTDSNQTIDYYKTQNHITVGVSKEIIVKLREKEALVNLLDKYPISLKTKLTSMLYVVECNSTKATLEVTNQLYHDANVSYAHPNLIKRINQR